MGRVKLMSYDCEVCGKKHDTPQAKYRHKKHCTSHTPNNAVGDDEIRKELRDIKEQLSMLLLLRQNPHTSNTITVNNFRFEKIDYLTKMEMVSMLKEDPPKAIVRFVKKIFLNPDHPENMTVYLEKYANTGYFWRNNKWNPMDADELVKMVYTHVINETLLEILEWDKVTDMCTPNQIADIKYVREFSHTLLNLVDGVKKKLNKYCNMIASMHPVAPPRATTKTLREEYDCDTA